MKKKRNIISPFSLPSNCPCFHVTIFKHRMIRCSSTKNERIITGSHPEETMATFPPWLLFIFFLLANFFFFFLFLFYLQTFTFDSKNNPSLPHFLTFSLSTIFQSQEKWTWIILLVFSTGLHVHHTVSRNETLQSRGTKAFGSLPSFLCYMLDFFFSLNG